MSMSSQLAPHVERLLPVADCRDRVIPGDSSELVVKRIHVAFGGERQEQIEVGPEPVGESA